MHQCTNSLLTYWLSAAMLVHAHEQGHRHKQLLQQHLDNRQHSGLLIHLLSRPANVSNAVALQLCSPG
jgi:hypothetical protein